jgi:predicted membrane metal-binding protein
MPPGPRRSPCFAYSSASRSRRAVADASAAVVAGPGPANGYGPMCRLLLLLLLLLFGVLRPGVPGALLLLLGTGLYLCAHMQTSSRRLAVLYFGGTNYDTHKAPNMVQTICLHGAANRTQWAQVKPAGLPTADTGTVHAKAITTIHCCLLVPRSIPPDLPAGAW